MDRLDDNVAEMLQPITPHQKTVKRPLIRYHGGKFRLAQWIMQFFPPHRIYVEAFGGAASILLQKPRAYSEVYNDLDEQVVNLFHVMRDASQRERLVEQLTFTPYSRNEFNLAWELGGDAVERARRLIIRAQMGFGSAGATKGTTGFRIDAKRQYETATHSWAQYPDNLRAVGLRLSGVLIENKPAIDLLRNHDTAETLFYIDPPYVHETRCRIKMGSARGYRHEMSIGDHVELLKALKAVSGMVVVSGYDHPLYNHELRSWKKVTTNARISSSRGTAVRQECLWINPACENALEQQESLPLLPTLEKDLDMFVPKTTIVGDARTLAGLRVADCIDETIPEIRDIWHAHIDKSIGEHPRESYQSRYLAGVASFEAIGSVSREKYCVGDPLMYYSPEGNAVKMWWGYPIHITSKKQYRILAFNASDLGTGIALDPSMEIGVTIFPAPNDHGVFCEQTYPHLPLFITHASRKGRDIGRIQIVQVGPENWTWGIEMNVNNESWTTPATVHTSAKSDCSAIEQALTPLILRLARLAGNPAKADTARRSAKYLMSSLLSRVQTPSQTTIINTVRCLLTQNG